MSLKNWRNDAKIKLLEYKEVEKMTLEKMINVKIAMLKNKPKSEVQDKYLEYLNEYDNKEKTIRDKLEHRELFYAYLRYMERTGVKE